MAKGGGNRPDQLYEPIAVLIDRINRSLIIVDYRNRRVVRWPFDGHRRSEGNGKVIISNMVSSGLAVDDEGSLHVSDWEKHEVRRYGRIDEAKEVIVAGGHVQGTALNQLNCPQHIFDDVDNSVYVSESGNHRVMEWTRDAQESVVVAGDQNQGNSLKQLNMPSGIFVDRMSSVYVADALGERRQERRSAPG